MHPTTPPIRRLRWTTAALAAVALATAGCGEEAPTTSTAGPVAPEPTDAASVDVDGEVGSLDEGDGPVVDGEREDATSDQALPPGANPTGEPIVSVDGSAPWERLDITDLRRDGDTLTLEFALYTTPDPDANIPLISSSDAFSAPQDGIQQLAEELDQHITEVGGHPRRRSVSGVTLVDRDNANRHLVLRDTTNACLCTGFADFNLEDDTLFRHSAQFPAPPPGVTSMTVEVPNFPSVDRVPIREVG